MQLISINYEALIRLMNFQRNTLIYTWRRFNWEIFMFGNIRSVLEAII